MPGASAPGALPGWLTDPARARRAGWILIALGAAALIAVAGWIHTVGDYQAETDFYGAYVAGAMRFRAGVPDPALYRVVGPAYDALLAVVAAIVRDPYFAGQLISIASAVATWILWRNLVAARFGEAAALFVTAFFVANPIFFRTGYSAVSHGLALSVESAALVALLSSSGRSGRVLLAGLLTGAAALVRYPAVVMVPASLLILLALERPPGRSPLRLAGLYLAGLLLVVTPWTLFSMSRGHVPGEVLVQRAGFYLGPAGGGNVQDEPGALARPERAGEIESLEEVVARDPGGFAARAITGAGRHLAGDARALLGYPVALLALLGAAFSLRDGSWRRLAVLAIPWVLHFVLLAPTFYSPLYAMPLLPCYLTVAALAATSPIVKRLPVMPIAGVIVFGLSVQATITESRFAHDQTPFEVREAGRVLAREAAPGARVLARKGHIGYYGGREVVPFPRVETLAQLADFCRRSDVTWIYYSWQEGILRPEFWYLLDTTAVVPGLTLVHHTRRGRSSLYRIGSGFGRDPAWMADARRVQVHFARGAVDIIEDSNWWCHLILAGDAWSRGDAAAALQHADVAVHLRPREAEVWAVRGDALRVTGRTDEARDAYETALRLRPGFPRAAQGLRRLE